MKEGSMMCKVKHDLCPHSIKNLFLVKSSTYNLRGVEFHIPRFNTGTHVPFNSVL